MGEIKGEGRGLKIDYHSLYYYKQVVWWWDHAAAGKRALRQDEFVEKKFFCLKGKTLTAM